MAGYVPIFAPSKTPCAIYFYIKCSDRFMDYAVHLLLLMNSKIIADLGKKIARFCCEYFESFAG